MKGKPEFGYCVMYTMGVILVKEKTKCVTEHVNELKSLAHTCYYNNNGNIQWVTWHGK